MKRNIFSAALLLAAMTSLSLATTSCADDLPSSKYEPGAAVDSSSPAVYFDSSASQAYEFNGDDLMQFDVTVKRLNTSGAVTVPITVTATADGVTAPESVSFADGESSTTFTVDCSGIPSKTTVSFSISVPEGMSTPYGAGTDVLDGTVIKLGDWALLADDVEYRYENTSYDEIFERTLDQKLYNLEGTNRFRLTNFANSGVSLTFEVATPTDYYARITPIDNFIKYTDVFPDQTDTYNTWYFFNTEANEYPQWNVDATGSRGISYLLLYDYDPSSDYRYSYIYITKPGTDGTAWFTAYANYSDGTAGYLYIVAYFNPLFDFFTNE